jgi:hypothetical protein
MESIMELHDAYKQKMAAQLREWSAQTLLEAAEMLGLRTPATT